MMAIDMVSLLDDLEAETSELMLILNGLEPLQWSMPTPAEGWQIRDQVSHLAYFDETATKAATDPAGFMEDAARLSEYGEAFPDEIARRFHDTAPEQLLLWFMTARKDMVLTFSKVDPKARLPWYGPPMSAASSITARFMETWAHGQDIADALGIVRVPTDRIRHVAHLGVSTYGFSHSLHNLEVPEVTISVSLRAPSGAIWSWGPDDSAESISGDAVDFCLVVTQRRIFNDTNLQVKGTSAKRWMSIAQAFAGAPGRGRTSDAGTAI